MGLAHVKDDSAGRQPGASRLLGLSLVALGIVYGDIGTSPLYALRLCFFGAYAVPVTTPNVLGVLSLIFWALILVVSIKYLIFVMRADNRGEGGILALLALLDPGGGTRRRAGALVVLGLFGAALLYGDAMITPAISVLSAMEGIRVGSSALRHLVIPATVVVLVLLFLFQRRGTARIGGIFGPLMVLWFAVLAGLGVGGILSNPDVLRAVNPLHAFAFFADNGWAGFLVLGGVFLVVTGGEALYADMGHCGSAPIRVAWFGVALPGLLLNYFGQGAVILQRPEEATHPFYNLVPAWGVYPMVVLATVVTVVASQAVISGTFSLTRQAVQMGKSPPMEIVQTSPEEIGQIYMPGINRVLMVAAIALVLGFESSSRLAAAYGLAVSGTMVITTVLAAFVMRRRWGWHPVLAGALTAGFLAVDLAFLGANTFKVGNGGWFPLAAGCAVLTLMLTWSRGRELLMERVRARTMPLETLLGSIDTQPPLRVPGTGVFLTRPGTDVPGGLLHQLKLNQVLQERVLLLTSLTEDVPRVPAAERLEVRALRGGFYRVFVHYGFMQSPNLPVAIRLCEELELVPGLDADATVYYVDRATLVPGAEVAEMSLWRKRLYAFMHRNALRAVEFYRLPVGRSIELGLQIEI
jgi:KUP system potassium uptake protein